MSRFNHGRVLFAGDAAHQVSPFGARGANSGIQDTDNLVWKLKLVMDGKAPARLLDTYSDERVYAADENILNSTRSTDFITPKSTVSRTFRNATLQLARKHAFARKLVNSGRLSVPAFYSGSSLNTADADAFASHLQPGAPIEDAPVGVGGRAGWLIDQVGNRFQLLVYADDAAKVDARKLAALREAPIPVEAIVVSPKAGTVAGLRVLHDSKGLVAKRFDARDGSTYLLRPDQHLCARWRSFDAARVHAAVARATCND
jgi:3-(3-hydroxy-phenyl)propionate hydroxylase